MPREAGQAKCECDDELFHGIDVLIYESELFGVRPLPQEWICVSVADRYQMEGLAAVHRGEEE